MFDIVWYVTFGSGTVGPLTPAQLHVFVELGWVQPETPVKHHRMRRFVPAREVRGLLPTPAHMTGRQERSWRSVWMYAGFIVAGLGVGMAAIAVGMVVMRWCGK